MIFIERTKHTSFKEVKLMDYKFKSILLNDCISTINKRVKKSIKSKNSINEMFTFVWISIMKEKNWMSFHGEDETE